MSCKKIVCLFQALMLLVSCSNKDDLEILRRISVTVRTSEIIKNFTPYRPEDAEMPEFTEGTPQLLIRALIYDDNGNLAESFSKVVADYGATYSFDTGVAGASPTIVILSYCILGNPNAPSYQAYVVSGESSLSTLNVTEDNLYANIKWRTLGGYIQKVNSSVTSLDVSLQPLGAIMYYWFLSIHARDGSASAPDKYTFWHHSNDQVDVEDGAFHYSTTLPSSYSYYDSLSPSDYPSLSNIYNITFWMPGVFNISASYSTGSSSTKFYNDNIRVEAGKQYVTEINCSSLSVVFREGTR